MEMNQLTLRMLGKVSADNILKYFFFPSKQKFDISCKLSKETISKKF